jgi:hypothetical protein
MKKITITGLALLILSVAILLGVTPQKWELQRFEDYLAGKFEGISVSHGGFLSLSPKEEKLEGPPEEFYLSLITTAQGAAYLGTGHSGKIYKIDTDDKIELFYQAPEMHVYCLVQDKKGNLYAGTSPNGRIYKISSKGEGKSFFNPKEKYIWDLMFSENGNLLAAVGESGGIYEINPQGEGRLILKSEENHILCLEKTKSGGLLAGSGGKGVVYQISPKGKASILFETSYEEIRDLALDQDQNVYAAAGGKVGEPKKDAAGLVPTKTTAEITVTATAPLTASPKQQVSTPTEEQPGALYRINPEGIAKNLWSSDNQMIYSMLLDEANKKILIGTGNKGRIYEIGEEEKSSLLLQKDSEQVYLLLPQESRIYTLSNNPPSLNRLSPNQRFSGEYLSRVLDAEVLSSWGTITWQSELPVGASLQFQTRSGNSSEPDSTWSDWSPPYQKAEGEKILSPKGRYLQFKILFRAESGKMSPVLKKISLFYIQTNLAPDVKKIELLPPNEVYLKPPEQDEVIWGADVSLAKKAEDKEKAKGYVAPKKVQRKGYQTVTWEAEDPNRDSLFYALFIRREDESKWRVIKEKWVENIFAFDTSAYPDGVYYLKIQASDLPSNPSDIDRTAEKVSRPLIIDNSFPLIEGFQVTKQGNRLSVAFSAADALSYIKQAQFLVRPDDWQKIFPEDGICDSKRENFRFNVNVSSNSDNLIVVKVKDSQGNSSVHRATF